MKENEDAVAATVSHIIHYSPNFPLFILKCGYLYRLMSEIKTTVKDDLIIHSRQFRL